ncbi:R3H domain-containing protein 2 [Culicoides brevitarsis]|uniref:R3H domain-containing protein 2 n=1 Tax=Culicoides brevitarsis TaxID=469753 RepID=UPI00307B292F
MASKSKLLVRSHAIQESASPPPSPFKQELKEEQDEDEEQLQKSNHDLHLVSPTTTTTTSIMKKDDDTEQKLDVKKNAGAIQKNVQINASNKETEKIEKPKMKQMGSSSSFEGASSGFISRESSYEQHMTTDHNGVSLLQFFHETLNKNAKDRNMLLKIEKELYSLATDKSRTQVIFPPMCSYNRMLIHRVAAYFGMEHNVDATQQCVIAGITKLTRVPDIRFKTLINDGHSDEYKKSILKRSAHSFDECKQTEFLSAHNRGTLSRKTKSFEERQHNYEKIKHRIFKDSGNISMEGDWSRSSSVLHDESKANNTANLPDYQCQVLELLKNKRNESNESHDRPPNDNPCKYGALWAVTDITLVPKGSILIDPQTLKPIVNADNTIYTYDPDNFPPNPNKGPIVKLNDVKINLVDEIQEAPVEQQSEYDPSCECKEKVEKPRFEPPVVEEVVPPTTVYFKNRTKPPSQPQQQYENQNEKPQVHVQQMKFQPNYHPKPLSPDKIQYEHPAARFSLNCPFTYTMTNGNASTYWASQHIPFRIPSQDFGMPLPLHGAYIHPAAQQQPHPPHNHKNPLRIDDTKAVDLPSSMDPRFTFSYAQGAFPGVPPPMDPNAVINIYGQQLSQNHVMEASGKKECNCATTTTPEQHDGAEKDDKNDGKFKYAPKNFNNNNNNAEKKYRKDNGGPGGHRYKFQNSIQPHSNNFHEIRLQPTSTFIQDGDQHRIVHSNLGPNQQHLHNGIASGNQYPRKNNHIKSDRL